MRAWILFLAAPPVWLALILAAAPPTARAQAPPERPPDPAARSPMLPAAAQPQAPSANGENKPFAAPGVERSPLDTFLLRDSKGNLVPVLGMPFEEFEQLLRLKRGLAPPPGPDYMLDSLTLTGSADGEVAHLQLTVTARIHKEGWVRVPLQMPGAVVRQPPKYEGPGEHFLSVDEATEGYLLWLKGADDKPHVVSVPVAIRLSTLGDESSLKLSLPRATESSLRVAAPLSFVEGRLVEGDGILTIKPGERQSELLLVGAGGDLDLRWKAGEKRDQTSPVQLDASGEVLVSVESENRITSDARLRVRSYSGSISSFQVRLPPGMVLVPIPVSGYTLTPEATAAGAAPPSVTTADAATSASGQVVNVVLDRPASEPTEVRLLATLQANAVTDKGVFPARFEVLGAVRQRGTIDVEVAGEWQIAWTEDNSVRRLDLAADAARPKLVARYEYFQQPSNLAMQVSARPSRVGVEPTYMIFVDPRQIRLEATLRYRFRGARAEGLTFDLGDWEFGRLTPDALLDAPKEPSTGGGAQASESSLTVPFRLGTTAPTELELKLEAHRPLAEGTDELRFALPRPLADVVAPATVVVVPADNVELSATSEEMIGLAPDASGLKIPGRQQSPLVYRDLGGGEPGVFAAKMRVRPRAITTSARANVSLADGQLQVEQNLEYRIAHEPERRFALLAPEGLSVLGGMQVTLNGEPVSLSAATDVPATRTSLEAFEFSAPTDKIGQHLVQVRYRLPLPAWDQKQPLEFAVPLVLPADERNHQFAGQQVTFVLPEGTQIKPVTSGLDEFGPGTSQPASAMEPTYTWSKANSITRWLLQPNSTGEAAAHVQIARAWYQTSLTKDLRQDRVALALTTQLRTLRVRLPSGTSPARAEVAINAQRIAVQTRDPLGLVIDIPAALHGRELVLELWYSLPSPARYGGIVRDRLRPADLEGASLPRRSYWQFVLPPEDHLLFQPSQMASEMAWSTRDWPLVARPLLDQRELEDWIHASRQPPLPAGARQYLFGALGGAPSLDVVLAPRRLLIGLASGLALLVGLALIHVPAFRTPTAWVVAAAIVACVALVWPNAAALLGQFGALGLAVAGMAAFGAWLRRGPVPSVAASSSALLRSREAASTNSPTIRPERISQISTDTAPTATMPEVGS